MPAHDLAALRPFRTALHACFDRCADALSQGAVDVAALQVLLRQHTASDGPAVYAVDLSTWPRCDAEASPDRGFDYHPSRQQPIVTGWAYQWLAQLSFTLDSWTTALDVWHVHPHENANLVAVEQIKTPVTPPIASVTPLCVFDAGYDSAQLTLELSDTPWRSWFASALIVVFMPPRRPQHRHYWAADRASTAPSSPARIR